MTLSQAVRIRIKNLLKQNNMNIWQLYKATRSFSIYSNLFYKSRKRLNNSKNSITYLRGLSHRPTRVLY